jgi:hypothetical protein
MHSPAKVMIQGENIIERRTRPSFAERSKQYSKENRYKYFHKEK